MEEQQAPKKKEMPEGVWMKCPGCEKTVFRKLVEERLWVCPECNYHFTLTAAQRIEMLLDPGSFTETSVDLTASDPLQFTDLKAYPARIAEYQAKSGLKDAAICGSARIKGRDIALAIMDSSFIMASMGSVVGEKIARTLDDARERGVPAILICASGGARMQEGLLSLMQMAKTSAAVARLHDAGGLYIAVFTNPTTAGVLASFASLGYFIIAEPGALIGFTGPRVIKETIKAELPDGFQTSEFLLEHGFIDRVVNRGDLRDELGRIMDYCKGPVPAPAAEPAKKE